MKGKIIGKILVILLAIVMVLPLSAFAASAEETPDTNAVPEYIQDIYRNGRTPEAQADYNGLKWQLQLESDISYVSNYVKEQEKLAAQNKSTKATKEALETTKKALDDIRAKIPNIVAIAKDAENGGDFDTAACIDSVVSSISTIASYFGPVGSLVSGVIDLGNTIFKLAMGGEAATSDLAQMEDRLNQQLDDIQNQLSEIEEQINGLSNEINESTNTIINEVTSAIDNADAKAYLRTFMLSGEGNFSYNQYRNYIYGTIENNPKSNTAYYSWLKKSLNDGASDETVKYYYDKLYSTIVADMDAYYDYIVGSDNSKSIVQYYYDVVSARPDFESKNGLSAKDSAIMFAYDLYQTELMASQIIMSCNLYQYTYMYERGKLVDVTDGSGNVIDKKVAPLELYYYDNENAVSLAEADGGMWEQLNDRINDIHNQLARDITYILDLDDSYIVESADQVLFEVVNSNPDTYGYVLANQIVYLNKIPEEVCDLFGFDANDFTYVVSVLTHMDGAFLVDSNANRIEATLYYNGEELDTMSFTVGANPNNFNGGNGTASDPYLIASAAQFDLIRNGLDKHYRLIDNIDFNDYPEQFTPIGQRINSNGSVVYDEFVGSLDGNGYTLSNLNVVGHINSGLFGIIGETGEVADLKLYNVKVFANITNAEKSTSEFSAGIIAGKNNGIIKYCKIDNEKTSVAYTVDIYNLKEWLEDDTLTDAQRDSINKLINLPGWTFYDVRDVNDYNAGLVDPLEPIKTFYAPYYGVFVTVSTNANSGNRNVFTYVGGIAGVNNNAIVCSTISNSHISASTTHSFGGNNTNENHNELYSGGICGKNSGAIAYIHVDDNTIISSNVDSIYNHNTTVRPYVVSYAGGVVGKSITLNELWFIESEAVVIRNEVSAYEKSNWDKFMGEEQYDNCDSKEHQFVPGYSDSDLLKIKATESVEEFIAKTERNYTVTFDCPDTVYEAGSDVFNTENLKFFINGVEKEYEIVDIYGFDAQNEEFNSIPQNIVVLFSVEIEGETVYFAQDITVTIKENVVTSIAILNLKDSYVKDTFSLEGLVIKYNYAVGNPEYVTINSENISQVRYFGNITTFGTQSIALLYNGDTVEFEINVVCGHGNNFTSSASGYTYDESLSKEPTCTEIGYNAYVCDTCGDIQYFYLRKVEHTPDYENAVGATDATCTEEGNTGKICCIDCGETLIDGKVIPKLTHHYVYVDGDKHACTNGSHSEYHHYTVTESHQFLDLDEDGTKEWYIVYTYTCVCRNQEGEIYSYTEEDENTITEGTKELPTISVSNGYVTSGGEEVVVYVQLTNNRGLKSAVFGIRYDRGLELVGEPQTGNLFKNLTIPPEKEQIDYGYNFVFANAALVSGDGNLVKLTFKVTDEAKIGDIFNISVVYNEMGKSIDGKSVLGGFSDGSKINVVTRDGYVKVVGEGQLPGDVNNDNIVDLMDAVLLAKFYANSEKYPLSTEDADINLDRDITPDDIVALLEYLVGGYGTNLLTQDFEIVLNTNGYGDIVLNDLLVSIYGDNNTYDAAGLNAIIADIENRTGYKFLGWYDQMVGGNLIFGGDKTEDILVMYNKNQKKQTLYAHWELNKISFDGNGADGNIEDIYYTEGTTIELQNTYENKYNIVFVSDKCENQDGVLWYEFLGWNAYNKGYDKDGKLILIPILNENGEPIYYYAKSNLNFEEILDDFLNDHYGEVILVADWSKKPHLDYPEFLVNGYENTIHWYGDSEYSTDEIFPGINDEYIIHNLAPVANKYKIYAKHTPIVYDIVFDFNNGTSNSIPTTVYGRSIESPYTIVGTVQKTGYKFVKWVDDFGYEYSQNDELNFVAGATQGCTVTLTAQWEAEKYTITFDANGGSIDLLSDTFTYNSSYDVPTPQRDGYEFDGWYYNNTKYSGGTWKIADSVTLTAKWNANTYKVDFDLNRSSIKKSPTCIKTEQNVVYGSSDSLPIPTAEYYVFDGWYTSDGVKVSDQYGRFTNWSLCDNVTLIANWKQQYENAIYIKDANELKTLLGQENKTYMLIDDITSVGAWTPISSFNGVLDGQHHTISGMTYSFYNGADVDWGMFNTINKNASVKDISFESCSATYVASSEGYAVYEVRFGFIAAFNYGTITGCTFNANNINIDANTKVSNQFVYSGIVVCENYGTISGCTSNGNKINIDSDTVDSGNNNADDKSTVAVAGGICAYNQSGGTVTGCTSINNTVTTRACYLSDDGEDVKAVSGGMIGFQYGAQYSNTATGNTLSAIKRYYTVSWSIFGKATVKYGGEDSGDSGQLYARS